MAGFFGKWSKTAASNASSDSTINWAEGMAPSAVNDSARAMMASAASYRDDTSGSLIVGGTSTAFTLTTNQAFASTSDLDGQEISFVMTPTNGAAATLNVNGIGAYALVFSAGNAMPAGSLVDGSIYTATFSLSLSCWKVRSYFGSVYNIPIAGMLDFIGSAVPNANFVFPIGQAISRTTYAALFALTGTTYGAGDGSTTFNVPDLTGRVTAMKEASATRLTTAGGGVDGATLGAVGGVQNGTVLQANLPAVTLATTITDPGHTHANTVTQAQFALGSSAGVTLYGSGLGGGAGGIITSATTGITASTALGGSGTAFKLVQPTMIVNKILRII